jgi:NAD(P)-dependent dehydrogenase (short-subunit alcohol dehydrogenase family)
MATPELALIVGAGSGLSGSLAKLCVAQGMRVALAARNTEKLKGFSATLHRCDATRLSDVEELFQSLDVPDLVVYNASYRVRGPLLSLNPDEVEKTLRVTAYGGFLVAQAAARRMLERGSGSLFFTGASASVKGYAESAPFAMGKFVIDGGISRSENESESSKLHPDAIARTYLDIHRQQRSAWSFEVDLRPWVERF